MLPRRARYRARKPAARCYAAAISLQRVAPIVAPAHTTTQESAMTTSHIRRIVLITIVGCAILAGSAGAVAARPIDTPSLPAARTATSTPAPRASSSGERNDRTLPIAFAVAVVLVAVGISSHAYRTRTSRQVMA
jgi:hypothetical protein